MRDFCIEFDKLASTEVSGPLTQRLACRMSSGALSHVETCPPSDMHGEVLKDSLDCVDYVWTNDYKRTTNKRIIHHGMGIDVMDLSWNPVAETWLLRTAAQYLAQNSRRLCVVLDMSCPFDVARELPDIEDYYKQGANEGYLFLPMAAMYEHFSSCLYWGLGMSYGCLVTLPEGLTREDILTQPEVPLSAEKATLLADCADAVYIGAYDGLGYMIGWFGAQTLGNPERLPE